MGFAIVALLVFAVIIFSTTYSLEDNKGFIAPLITRTSPKHPLYNPNASRNDIVRKRQKISAEREKFFIRKRRGLVPNQAAPIDDQIIMTYFIGTPPVETLAIPDTGSEIIWVQCKPCQKCSNQTKPIFDPKHSSSYQLLTCDSPNCREEFGFTCASRKSGCFYHISYVDNTTSRGVVATDTLSIPQNEHSPKFTHPKTVFGCGLNNEDDYNLGISGIVGLQNLSISLPRQIGVRTFSYCLGDGEGYIRFGSVASLVGSSAPLFTDESFQYQVPLIKIAVANETHSEFLNINSDIFKVHGDDPDSGVIFDSGTPYTSLNLIAFKALERKIGEFMEGYESYTASGWEVCYNENENVGISFDTMPMIHFVFANNMTLKFPKENIWTSQDNEGNLCLQMFPSLTNLTTLGSEQFVNYNVGFDLSRNLLWLDYQIGCTGPAEAQL